MGYVYSALWLIIAVLLFVRFKEQGKLMYLLSGYFVFMSIWWFVNQIVEVDLMKGMYGWIFRFVTAVVAVIIISVYFRSRHRQLQSDSSKIENKSEK